MITTRMDTSPMTPSVCGYWQGSRLVVTLRVHPGSRRNQLEQDEEGVLRLRVNAPPVDGKANHAVVCLLAEYFGVPKSSVQILAGDSSRTKRIAVEAPVCFPKALGFLAREQNLVAGSGLANVPSRKKTPRVQGSHS